jgi:hypothetical protein
LFSAAVKSGQKIKKKRSKNYYSYYQDDKNYTFYITGIKDYHKQVPI